MDNSSDTTIIFDEYGNCNYCTSALVIGAKLSFPTVDGEKKIIEFVKKIKSINKNKIYDCIIGLSGGLDSSYLAYLSYKWGLRILGVHIDDGFDTEIARENIRKLCDSSKIDLVIVKPDKEQFCSLTKAYMYACVPNIAVPQDNIIIAEIYKIARKRGIRHILSGENYALECILQNGNTHTSLDVVNIKSINKLFGTKSINKLNFISYTQIRILMFMRKVEIISPLNYVDYNKDNALKELKIFCDYKYYESKHLENALTAFIQLYWFYHKFGVDKRTSHLSSMIVSGQISREMALKELEKPIYDTIEMEKNVSYIISKLGMTREEFNKIMSSPAHQHTEYKISRFPDLIRRIKQAVLNDSN